MVLNPKTNIISFNANSELRTMFMSKVKEFINQIPVEIKGKDFDFIKNTINQLETNLGSKINYFNSKSENAFRGFDLDKVTHLIIDNSAWVDINYFNQDTLDRFLSKNAKVIFSSTNTNDYDVFKDSDFLDSDDKMVGRIEIFWFEDPRYNKDLGCTADGVKITTIDPRGYELALKLGYLPTNEWFKKMCKAYNYDEEKIKYEIGLGYIEKPEDKIVKTVKAKINFIYTTK